MDTLTTQPDINRVIHMTPQIALPLISDNCEP